MKLEKNIQITRSLVIQMWQEWPQVHLICRQYKIRITLISFQSLPDTRIHR